MKDIAVDSKILCHWLIGCSYDRTIKTLCFNLIIYSKICFVLSVPSHFKRFSWKYKFFLLFLHIYLFLIYIFYFSLCLSKYQSQMFHSTLQDCQLAFQGKKIMETQVILAFFFVWKIFFPVGARCLRNMYK